MQNIIKNLLDKLIDLLEKENRLLIKTINDTKYSQELIKVLEEKQKALFEISRLEEKDLLPFKEELNKIKSLTDRNMQLAQNNLEFIEEVFEAIFEEESPKQYTKDGEIQTKKEGLFNKKI